MATKKTAPKKGTAKKAAPAKKTVKAPKAVASKKTAKKATPAKKDVKKKAAPAKKAVVKKAAPSKKSAPAKKVVAKKAAPAKKAVAKKVAPNKKSVTTTKTKVTQVKKETKKSTAKAAAPAKKAVAKKAAPAPAKKAAPAKAAPAKKAVAKKAEAPAKKEAPKAAPAKKAAASKALAAKSAAIVKKAAAPAPAPTEKPKPTRRNAREEGKQQVIVAHRKLENKSKNTESEGKTMINYQPDFTRSILDAPIEQQGPVYRYSDEELNEFRVLITGRLEAARKELGYLQGLITRKDEAGTEDTENRYMNMEDGSGAMEREQLAQLASRQIQFINHLEKAMVRIENKTYGICRVTGKLIDKARLRAVPHATLSIEAKKMMSSR